MNLPDKCMTTLRILDIVEDTMVDGPGFRTSIYCAGCRHACPGCHNPQSWSFDGGREMTVEQIMRIIEADPYANVTFSGGDPMYQAAGFAELAQTIHQRTQKDIWCYTGFTFESLIQDDQRELLSHIDVLVDGPFIRALHDPDLLFRGSSNQRLIDVPASLYSGKTVLWKPDNAVLTV
jgi:anaerobic ribonucleoside-triphosphate reductase activating protein